MRTLPAMKPHLACLLLTAAAFAEPVEQGVRLLQREKEISPTSTFELRFDQAVVAGDRIGLPADSSPLVFSPALPGTFTWLSTRSGVFTPSEPPAPGATYTLTLAGDLPVQATLQREITTPPMRITDRSPDSFDKRNAPSSPALYLQFNVAVDPAALGKFARFRNAAGDEIPALVAEIPNDARYYLNNTDTRPWRERFTGPLPDDAPRPHPHRIFITPERPLPIAPVWKLLLAAGLPSAEGPETLPEPVEIEIGDVQPFTVDAVTPHHGLDAGTWLEVSFSKRISPLLEKADITKWISITPAPDDLRIETNWDGATFTGTFSLQERYTVTVKPGFPAAEPFELAESHSEEVTFVPLPPRLYFTGFSTAQYSGGRRVFDLLATNIDETRVRAKLLDRDSLIFALNGYKRGYHKKNGTGLEPHQEVEFSLVPGKTVFNEKLDTSAGKVALSWDKILGGRRSGAVFLQAEKREQYGNGAELGTEAIVQLTDLGVLWKVVDDTATILVFSHATGEAVPGATVRLLDDDNIEIATRQAGPQGLAQLPLPKQGWLMAEAGDDLHAMEFDRDTRPGDLPSYAFREALGDGASGDRRVLLFTDRPLYQPGETVHLKGYLREWQGGDLIIPAEKTYSLTVVDARDTRVLAKDITLSATGSFSEAIPLPPGGVGIYRASLVWGNATTSETFEVQEYKANAFEVALDSRDSYPAGEAIGVPLTAHYYSGAPLAGAAVKWSLRASDETFRTEGFGDFVFGGVRGEDRETTTTGQGDVKMDAEGRASVVLEPGAISVALSPRDVDLLVEITDINQQTISSRAKFTAHSSDFYLGIAGTEDVLRAGEPMTIAVIAIQPDMTVPKEQPKPQLTVSRIDFRTIRELGPGGAPTYRTEEEPRVVFETTATTAETRGEQNRPVRTATFTPDQPGTYIVHASTKDSAGREVASQWRFNVSGETPSRIAWNYRNQYQIDLVPDRASYQPGDTARLLVKTPISGTALVSIEREAILRTFVVTLKGNAPTIEVPIEAGDLPNVFVSVVLLRGAEQSPRKTKEPEFRAGYARLNVGRPETQLGVKVEAGEPSYRPATEVTTTVTVQDKTGKAVAGAEVTLYAVDEGILSLMGYEKPEPFDFFYAPRALRVRTGLTLPNLLSEDPDELSFANKGYVVGGGGMGSASSGEAPRSNFLPCAFWQADLVTDKDGRVTATFPAPDSLTRYRVFAVAATPVAFGSGESAFAVSKPLMVESALPPVARIGDKLTARAVLQNRTDTAGEVEVTLTLDDKAAQPGTLSRKIQLAPNSAAAVDIPVELANVGTAKWVWSARMGDLTDSVETTVEVGYVAPLLREILLGRTDAKETNLLAEANPQFLEGEGSMEIRVANTRLSGLAESVDYLLDYPYGCVEQQVSRLIPWMLYDDLHRIIPALDRPEKEVRETFETGVRRVLDLQTREGGLAYWPGGTEPMLWASAYGGVALALAKERGFEIPLAQTDDLARYLSRELRDIAEIEGNYQLSNRCLAVYALALLGAPEPAYHELLYKKRDDLSAESRAVLALAILEAKGPADMIKTLLDPDAPTPPQGDAWFGSGERELAMRLLAWVKYQPKSRDVDALVEELLRARRNGKWGNTQSNAWALLALTRYANAIESGDKRITGSLQYVDLDREFSLDEKNPAIDQAAPIVPAPLVLSNPSQRTLFTTVKMEARPKVAKQPRQDRGYLIERGYAKVRDDGKLDAAQDLKVGDRILVTLRIEVRQPAHYIAIDDPLPAVFEAVNPSFKTQAMRADGSRGSMFTDYRELRRDRALFFRDHLAPGSYTITYLARVRAAGAVTAPAAKIEEMYRPERFGLTETTDVTAQAR